MALQRIRTRFEFWLDASKPDEANLASQIGELKRERSFARTIREGIALIRDLRAGRVEVLLRLFPWVGDYFVQQSKLPEDDPIRLQLAALTDLMLQQGMVPFEAERPALPLPPMLDDDFDFEVKEAAHDENNRSDWNFMLASAMQVHGNCDGLPDDIIAYGLRTGRIKQRDVSRTLSTLEREVSGPKAMDVPQFDAPTFDDTDLPDW